MNKINFSFDSKPWKKVSSNLDQSIKDIDKLTETIDKVVASIKK